jgi:hypothetical protein
VSKLRAVDQDLWVAEQPLRYLGLSVGTRMTVIRLSTGALALISPVQPDPALIQSLNDLGPVQYLIAPNLFHHLFLGSFQAIYPEAEVWAVSVLAQKRPDLAIDYFLDRDRPAFNPELPALPIRGLKTLTFTGPTALEEYVFWHRASRTAIITDLAFCFDASFPWVTRLAARVLGSFQGLSPSRLEKLASRDRAALQQSLQAMLAWDFERMIMAHGNILEKDGKQQLQQGYDWVLRGME